MDSVLIQTLVEAINREYVKRNKKNANYSLRAYARHLGIDVSHLSKLLRGKKGLSRDRLILLGKKLNLGDQWLNQVQNKSTRGRHPKVVYKQIDDLQFRKMYHWYYSAIYELPLLQGFQSTPAWVAKTIGITIQQAKEALDLLQASGLLINLSKDEKKKILVRSGPWSYYRPDYTTPERRENQKQFLRKAIEVMDEVPMEWREQTTMTMASNAKNLKKARLLTQKFREDLDRLMSKGKNCKDIYVLNLSLFPVTRNFPR